ncbi:MAG: adenylate/guanylate cyclase domain-containing protein [Myxococcota bacterium]
MRAPLTSAGSRALLAALGLLFGVCASLHFWKLATGSLAWVPVHVSPPDEPGGAPTLSGFLPGDRATGEAALRVGDRLLRVGERDLTGVGRLGFALAAWEQGRVGAPAPLVVERNGARLDLLLPLRPFANPWRTLPLLLSIGGLSLLALWRMGRADEARAFALAGVAYSVHWSLFAGGPRWLSAASLGLALITAGLFVPLLLRAILQLPERGPPASRTLRLAPWLFVACAPATASWILGWPLDGELGLRALMALYGVALAAAIALVIRGLRRADALGRRRLKWVAWGFYVGTAPVIAGALVAAFDARWLWLYELSLLAMVMIPIGFYVAIARHHFGDIDRLIGATASYNLVLIALLGTGLVLVPRTAQAASSLLGIDPGFGQAAISLLLAGVIVPADRRLRPRIERLFFAERFALEQGVARLLAELASAPDPRRLLAHAGQRLDELLRPDGCVIYARDGAAFSPVFVRGRTVPASVPAEGALARLLADSEDACRVDRLEDDPRLESFDRALLDTLGAALVVPVRRVGTLVAFIALGAKQSGDVHTATDQALLASVAHQIASELARFDQAHVLAETRAMQEALRRFVPGAIAEELERGGPLEAEERECSLLFVDIRGYTSYAQGHRAHEIFSTVNEYTRRVSEVVRAHGGSVVEFNGDGMMAVFGAPRALADKERKAVLAGLEIVRSVPEIELGPGESPLSVGVGIATGDAFVGSIQAADRFIWSAIGNTTNLAARLQALTRDVSASMVVDAVSFERAGYLPGTFVRRPNTEIRGRSAPIDVYALPLDTPR